MKNQNKILAGLLLIQSLFMWAAVGILSTSVQWPQSLGFESKTLMTLVASHASSVQMGYFCYLLSTMLFIPIVILCRGLESKSSQVFLNLATAFGLMGAFFKIVGISRWLTIQPILARQYVETANESSVQIFQAINEYFGALGENFGVMLGVGLWTLFIGFHLRGRSNSKHLIASTAIALGLIIAAGFFEIVGLNLPGFYLTATGAAWQIWSVIFAIQLLKRN